MIKRHHLVEEIHKGVIAHIGEDLARPLFMRDIAWQPLNSYDEDQRLGLWLFFDREECIYIGFYEDEFYHDEISHIRAVLLGRKSFKDHSGKRWRTPRHPHWEAYIAELDRPRSLSTRSARHLYLSRFSALFFPMDFAVDRLYWGGILIQAVQPRCNYSVHSDKLIRQRLSALVPVGCSDEQQIAAIEKEGLVIGLIETPSEQVQIAAVRSYPYAIADIMVKGIKPSRDVVLAAANSHGHVIELLNHGDIDEEILLAAVQSTPAVISQIEAPSATLQEEAVTLNPGVISYIKDPTEEAQTIAVSHDPDLFFEIVEPCDDAKLAYLRQRPSEAVKLLPLSDHVKVKLIAEKPSLILLLIGDGFTDHPIGSEELREPIVRELLLRIKGRGSRIFILRIIERLKEIGYSWTELDAMEKSLRADIL